MTTNGRALVVRGGAEHLPLPDNSVDLIVTSPPYFGLRSYQDGGRHYDGQVGSEPTPAQFLDVLIACTREWVRVVKPSGSIWVNLGDSYFSGKGAPGRTTVDAKSEARTARRAGGNALDGPSFGIPRKSLIGLPWRYAIRCIDELGLLLRAEVVWSKPNGLPESVTDRVRRSHEQWFHFTLSPRYYSAVDEIREPHTSPVVLGRRHVGASFDASGRIGSADGSRHTDANPFGKLPGSVWTIPTEPLSLPDVSPLDGRPLPDHFAAFPMEWPRRIVAGWSPREVCTVCGEGRRPVTEAKYVPARARGGTGAISRNRPLRSDLNDPTSERMSPRMNNTVMDKDVTITGYACACPDTVAPATPGVVLDPFGGTGTVALVASVLGRTGITVDLSHDYCRLARWRTSDRGQVAKAMQVERPEPVMDGQGNLFGEETA